MITPVIIDTIIVPENLVSKSPNHFRISIDLKIPPKRSPKPAISSLHITAIQTIMGKPYASAVL